MRRRPSRPRLLAALVLAFGGAAAAPASAHLSNPDFESVLRGIAPPAQGVRAQVLGGDDQVQLTNASGHTVVVEGYDGEPYARLLADGTVQVNRSSPAFYLNQDAEGDVPVPPSANRRARPRWLVLAHNGRFAWHDHRIHWMAQRRPAQIKDVHRRTKVFDYRVGLRVGGRPAALLGTLYWVGRPSGFPAAAIVSLVVLAILGGGLIGWTRARRRLRGGGGAGADAAPAKEAW